MKSYKMKSTYASYEKQGDKSLAINLSVSITKRIYQRDTRFLISGSINNGEPKTIKWQGSFNGDLKGALTNKLLSITDEQEKELLEAVVNNLHWFK